MAIRYPFLNLKAINAPYRDRMLQAMAGVIDSGQYIGGAPLDGFEAALAAHAGTPHAVGCTNGLDALRLIFRAFIELGMLQRGDRVIVPANTYVASVLAVTDNGLVPVFVEPDPDTLNLDTSLLQKAYDPAVRAVLTVHLYGRVCFDAALKDFVQSNNLLLVEDNAQAIGAVSDTVSAWGTRRTGSLGHASAYSFYPTKNIGAPGDAGAVTTHLPRLAQAVRALRNYGSLTRYNNIYKGLNCRLDPTKAAALSVKLPDIDAISQMRRQRAAIYDAEIDNPLVTKPQTCGDAHVWHQYIVRVADRRAFRQHMLDNGVETAVHYAVPPHLQPCYAEYARLHLPRTTAMADSVVSLPITQATPLDDIRDIASIVNRYKG